jgi:hypothetical protein
MLEKFAWSGRGLLPLALFTLLGFISSRNSALAVELEPGDYTPLPAGSNVLAFYDIFANDTSYRGDGGPTLKAGTNLREILGIVKYAHYLQVGGAPAALEIYQIFGTLDNARLGGADLNSSSGVGDTNLAAFIWPFVEKNSYLGVGFYAALPTGAYNKQQPVNLGDNRFSFNPQILYQRNLTAKWSLELAGDAIFYSDNRDAGLGGALRLSQEATAQGQAFLNYSITPTLSLTAAYEGERGGTQKIDGLTNGASTNFDEFRLIGGWFLAPKIQILGEINHRFDVSGGFRQDFGATGRLLFLF